MKLIETEKIPIRMWLDEIEDGAMGQIKPCRGQKLLSPARH